MHSFWIALLYPAYMITVHVIFRDVPKLDRAREKKTFGAPMFEPKVSWKQMYCIEESTGDIVGTSGAPIAIPRLGDCAPLPYAPGHTEELRKTRNTVQYLRKTNKITILIESHKRSSTFKQRDAGGPLVQLVNEQSWFLVGIASNRQANSNCGITKNPGIFQRVSYYEDWIKSQWDVDCLEFVACCGVLMRIRSRLLNNEEVFLNKTSRA